MLQTKQKPEDAWTLAWNSGFHCFQFCTKGLSMWNLGLVIFFIVACCIGSTYFSIPFLRANITQRWLVGPSFWLITTKAYSMQNYYIYEGQQKERPINIITLAYFLWLNGDIHNNLWNLAMTIRTTKCLSLASHWNLIFFNYWTFSLEHVESQSISTLHLPKTIITTINTKSRTTNSRPKFRIFHQCFTCSCSTNSPAYIRTVSTRATSLASAGNSSANNCPALPSPPPPSVHKSQQFLKFTALRQKKKKNLKNTNTWRQIKERTWWKASGRVETSQLEINIAKEVVQSIGMESISKKGGFECAIEIN